MQFILFIRYTRVSLLVTRLDNEIPFPRVLLIISTKFIRIYLVITVLITNVTFPLTDNETIV